MNPIQTTPPQELAESVKALATGIWSLEEVLDIFFQTLASQGVQPSVHLQKARLKVKTNLGALETTSHGVARQLEMLNELARTTALITSTLELDAVLDEVMDTVISMTGAERAYLLLYDDSRQLTLRAARNWEQSRLNPEEVGVSQSVVNTALETGVPVITTNAQADSRFSDKESIQIQALRSIICIPLSLGGKIAGVLYADNRLLKGLFTTEIVPILTAFGTQAAIAITNAQLYGQVQGRLQEAQQVIEKLQIEVDRGKIDRQVTQITDTSYFRELAEAAKQFRSRGRARQ